MLAKFTVAGLAGSLLLASVAFAQTPTATTDRPTTPPVSASDSSSSFQGNWRTSKMAGLSVYNDKNESVGSINDFLTDKNGKITAVIIGVGGFLGVGEHLVAIPFEKVKFSTEPVVYTGTSGASNTGMAKPGGAGGAGGTSSTTGASTSSPANQAKPNPWYPDHAVFNAT